MLELGRRDVALEGGISGRAYSCVVGFMTGGGVCRTRLAMWAVLSSLLLTRYCRVWCWCQWLHIDCFWKGMYPSIA